MKPMLTKTSNVRGPRGDMSGVKGDVTDLSGNATGLRGDVTDIRGDVDKCGLTENDRMNGVDISTLITTGE